MFKRFVMIFLTLLIAITAILLAASYPTGPNTISYDDPASLWISIGMVTVLFLPPLLLSVFNHFVVKIISAVYQGFIMIAFIGLILASLFTSAGASVTIAAVIGTIMSILSILVTIFVGSNKNRYTF